MLLLLAAAHLGFERKVGDIFVKSVGAGGLRECCISALSE